MPSGKKKTGPVAARPISNGATKKKPVMSKSLKSGLLLPVARVNKLLKQRSGMQRVGGSSPVYLTAVAEYLAAEILELAGNEALKSKRRTIALEDLTTAIRKDHEMNHWLASFHIISAEKIKAKRPGS